MYFVPYLRRSTGMLHTVLLYFFHTHPGRNWGWWRCRERGFVMGRRQRKRSPSSIPGCSTAPWWSERPRISTFSLKWWWWYFYNWAGRASESSPRRWGRWRGRWRRSSRCSLHSARLSRWSSTCENKWVY